MDELRAAVRRYRRTKAAERGAWEHLQTATTAAIAAGLSQSAAAEVVGVDRMTIRKWMGKR